MLSIDEYTILADEAALELPEGLFDELNGGINVVADEKLHKESRPNAPLYIMGTYHHEPQGLGRYIVLYYGSFIKVYPNVAFENARTIIRDILYHELTHHIESLAGDYSLEIEDAKNISEYRNQRSPKE